MQNDSRARRLLAVILGSGLGGVVESARILGEVPYENIVSMGRPGVEGHRGKLLLAGFGEGEVLLFDGRRHLYEGVGMEGVSVPVKIAAELGYRFILVTSAAGSLKSEIPVGDWFLPDDVVNFPNSSALLEVSSEGDGSMHPSMEGGPESAETGTATERRPLDGAGLISSRFREMMMKALVESKARFHEGTLLWVPGPNYETSAEVGSGVAMGASVVTMSGLPELVAASREGIEACPLCWISNHAGEISGAPVSHDDVLKRGKELEGSLVKLIEFLVDALDDIPG